MNADGTKVEAFDTVVNFRNEYSSDELRGQAMLVEKS
jgi:hypothetical protein